MSEPGSWSVAGLMERLELWLLLTTLLPSPLASLASFAAALLIAFAWYRWRYRRRGRGLRARQILALLFPRAYLAHASHRLDLAFALAGVVVLGTIIAWAALSYVTVSHSVATALAALAGPGPHLAMPAAVAIPIATVVLFLGYELAYWLDHYLAHCIPLLWEFHKVHHSAEALSPLTNFRVHPVDTIVYANISALVLGTLSGMLAFLFGSSLEPLTLLGVNAILLVFSYTIVQLQHSQVWIPFTGTLGRIVLSPAHHQIHHSADPLHHNRNLGACLAVFDWLFGTLHVPSAAREKLTFGVEAGVAQSHSPVDALLDPFRRAPAHLAHALDWAPGAAPPRDSARPG